MKDLMINLFSLLVVWAIMVLFIESCSNKSDDLAISEADCMALQDNCAFVVPNQKSTQKLQTTLTKKDGDVWDTHGHKIASEKDKVEVSL